jgi:TAG lipase/steryl ester hydrolase/phospholipase A2/LPA acyltransferase
MEIFSLLFFSSFVSLSGGGYLGYYHMGVVKALWTQVMLPRVISGSSAGSIMTAIIG